VTVNNASGCRAKGEQTKIIVKFSSPSDEYFAWQCTLAGYTSCALWSSKKPWKNNYLYSHTVINCQ